MIYFIDPYGKLLLDTTMGFHCLGQEESGIKPPTTALLTKPQLHSCASLLFAHLQSGPLVSGLGQFSSSWFCAPPQWFRHETMKLCVKCRLSAFTEGFGQKYFKNHDGSTNIFFVFLFSRCLLSFTFCSPKLLHTSKSDQDPVWTLSLFQELLQDQDHLPSHLLQNTHCILNIVTFSR